MTSPRAEKAYEKHAWILLFSLGIFNLLSSLGLVAMGQPFESDLQRLTGKSWGEIVASNPGLEVIIGANYRALGLGSAGFALLVVAISVKSFRRGERWSWYALWYFPFSFGVILGFGAGGSFWILAMIETVLFVAGLLLPVRKFFPRQRV